MQATPTISVRLLMMLAGHFGQPARAKWSARFTFLGARAGLIVRDGKLILPSTSEIARATGQHIASVSRNLGQLKSLGMLEPGVIDDPISARPNPPERLYTTYDLKLLQSIWKKTGSYEVVFTLIHFMTFLQPGSKKIVIDSKFRTAIAYQMGVRWRKIRAMLSKLQDIQVLEEEGRREGRVIALVNKTALPPIYCSDPILSSIVFELFRDVKRLIARLQGQECQKSEGSLDARSN